MKKVVLGIDVGGTNVKMGLVNTSGKVLARAHLATSTFHSRAKLIEAITASAEKLLSDYAIRSKDLWGVGLGLPGLIDHKKGIVKVLVNIPGWKDVPLQRIFERKFQVPTFIDNDVNVITLGEWKYGSGRGASNIVCLTLGTGVGGGLILNNDIYRGSGNMAGEIGHIPLNEVGLKCNCGGYACLERTIGNLRLLEKARKVFSDPNITLEEITLQAGRGQPKAKAFWHEVGMHLGNALTGVVNLLNPDLIIIGGGVANAFSHIAPSVLVTIRRRAMAVPSQMVKIIRARLGNDGGIIGTQVLVENALSSR